MDTNDDLTAAQLEAALDHVREHGFGDDVDSDSIIEVAAIRYLELLRDETS